MKRSIPFALALLLASLAGCASQPSSVSQDYTDEQAKQYALEVIGRSGLSPEDYEKVRSALINPQTHLSRGLSRS